MQADMAMMNREYFMNVNLFEQVSEETQVVLICLYEVHIIRLCPFDLHPFITLIPNLFQCMPDAIPVQCALPQ
jgi:hypothetical protein